MTLRLRFVPATIISIDIIMILIIGFHVGGEAAHRIGLFSPLFGAFAGGGLLFFSLLSPQRRGEQVDPWIKREWVGWAFIGSACIIWGVGECFWRNYLAHGQNPFPSLADIGYASFPPLVFSGLLILPASNKQQTRLLFILDSLIATGALLSIAWFLLLGTLTQTPSESVFAKVLGIYYPTMDTALLSGTILLILREPDRLYLTTARRITLLMIGAGLAVFATSDFLFNVQQNLGTYVDGTWVDLGWPIGMMTIGLAAYLRRFLPATSDEVIESRIKQRVGQLRFETSQSIPYLLLLTLFSVLVFNALSGTPAQQSIRPVLVIATMLVVCLVIVRQILTMIENMRLLRAQKTTLQKLEQLNQSIGERNSTLETGINHLKDIQTRLANGEVRVRATITGGELWPLAIGLNLMADRMMRTEQSQLYAQKLSKAIDDASVALSRTRNGNPFVTPLSCLDFPEMKRLLRALGINAPNDSSLDEKPLRDNTPSITRSASQAFPPNRSGDVSAPHWKGPNRQQ